MKRIPLIALSILICACSTTPPPGDVTYLVDAFRAPADAPVKWVAWTDKGLETEAGVIAKAGTGCLPTDGWPGQIAWIPGDPGGFWLYGTKPNLTGEPEEVTFDCLVLLDGTTQEGSRLPFRVGGAWSESMQFGSTPAPWRKQAASAAADLVTPAGVASWRLAPDPQRCSLADTPDGPVSACVAPGGTSVVVTRWQETPEGIVPAESAELSSQDDRPRIFISEDAIVAVHDRKDEASVAVASQPFAGTWSTPPTNVSGTVLSVVPSDGVTWVLTSDGAGQNRLVELSGTQVTIHQLPTEIRPTKLHRASDGTLWGAGLGAAWRLDRFLER